MNPAGVIYAVLASCVWGVVPIFWRALASIPPLELIAQRVIWTAVFSGILLTVARRWREIVSALSSRSHALRIVLGATLIVTNWIIFVWAVVNDHVLDASLGYYLTPLVSVLLGLIVLRERLSTAQGIAVGLALLGVLVLVFEYRGLPWISLCLAVTFGTYGLMHKLTSVNPIARLTIESSLMIPLAFWFLTTQRPQTVPFLGSDEGMIAALVVATGPVTITPLVLFGSAARRLTLTSLGLFQYLGPTITFLLAIFGFGEPFSAGQAVTFSLIWAALILYSYDSFRA